MQAGLLSSEIRQSGVPTPCLWSEGNIAGWRYREPPADSAESKNPGMYRNSRRENREVPHLPAQVIAGRDAQGRLRPQA